VTYVRLDRTEWVRWCDIWRLCLSGLHPSGPRTSCRFPANSAHLAASPTSAPPLHPHAIRRRCRSSNSGMAVRLGHNEILLSLDCKLVAWIRAGDRTSSKPSPAQLPTHQPTLNCLLSPETSISDVPTHHKNGRGGIRTPVRGLTPETVFETAAFNRSATLPSYGPKATGMKLPLGGSSGPDRSIARAGQDGPARRAGPPYESSSSIATRNRCASSMALFASAAGVNQAS
jgi:hypothetical protein